MFITHETATTIMVGIQALGTISAVIYGVIRIERRFTKLEINIKWIKGQCPYCPEDQDDKP